MKCKKKYGSSWLWLGILRVRSLLANGLCYKLGKWDMMNFWGDPWIPNRPDFLPKLRNQSHDTIGMVSSMKLGNGAWDENVWLGFLTKIR